MSADDDLRRVAQALPTVRIRRGDTVDLEPDRWLWHGFLPAGVLTILGGSPGCGKTTILLSLAATLTIGGTWPDGSRCAESGDVLIWSGEDAHSVLAARLVAASADMRRVHFIDGVSGADEDGSFDPGRDMRLLESVAESLPNLRLLILDPIVSAVTGDSHKNAEVRRALQPVVDLAQRTGCALVGITHFSKGTAGRDPAERITGSLAFAALPRLVLVAAKVKADDDEEPRRVFLRAKANNGPDDGGFAYTLERVEVAPGVQGQRVRWREELQGSARDVLAEAEAEPESEADDAAGFLRGVLSDGPVAARSILADANGAGFSRDQVQRAARRLGVERRKVGMSAGWVWKLPNTEGGAEDGEGSEDGGPDGAPPSVPPSPEDGALQKVPPSLPSPPSVPPSGDVEAI